MRLHSASHSSMLCDVMITVCPACVTFLCKNLHILVYAVSAISCPEGSTLRLHRTSHFSVQHDVTKTLCAAHDVCLHVLLGCPVPESVLPKCGQH